MENAASHLDVGCFIFSIDLTMGHLLPIVGFIPALPGAWGEGCASLTVTLLGLLGTEQCKKHVEHIKALLG